MRLNKKTYPIMEYLDNPGKLIMMKLDECIVGDIGQGTTPEESKRHMMEWLKGIQDVLSQIKPDRRFALSGGFTKAVEKALPKMQADYVHLDPKPDCGMIIVDGGVVVYLTAPADKQLKLLLYGFTREAHTCYAMMTPDNKCFGSYRQVDPKTGELVQRNDLMTHWVNSMLAVLYFINNCEVETKEMKQGQKHRTTGKGAERFFNENKLPVTVLDCTWFTELVAVNASKVNGHYRWQPVGEGRSKKKLIFIDEYEKGPYKRRAKKEINNGKDTETGEA